MWWRVSGPCFNPCARRRALESNRAGKANVHISLARVLPIYFDHTQVPTQRDHCGMPLGAYVALTPRRRVRVRGALKQRAVVHTAEVICRNETVVVTFFSLGSFADCCIGLRSVSHPPEVPRQLSTAGNPSTRVANHIPAQIGEPARDPMLVLKTTNNVGTP